MALYKVPQDVEAEDKLIGPFSFRQFAYLGVAALGIAAGVGLWQIFPGLIVIPLPIVVLFLALALPLRKDQPMEMYLTAVIRYFLKPRKRMWHPEGSIGLVTIVAPRIAQVQLTKSVGGAAAAAQLDYLSQVLDTQGWAARGVIAPTLPMNDDAYAEAQQAEDVLDENADVARSFDTMINKSSDSYRQTVTQQFQQAAKQPPSDNAQMPVIGNHAALYDKPIKDTQPSSEPTFDYDPYPASMHQHIINPVGADFASHVVREDPDPLPMQPVVSGSKAAENNNAQTPSVEQLSPDIMRLANNNDLSISAIANEAHRIEGNDDTEEVVVNLH